VEKNQEVGGPAEFISEGDSAKRNPIDTSLIDHCLRLSHEERIEAHESTRQLVKDLQQAGRKFYAGQS